MKEIKKPSAIWKPVPPLAFLAETNSPMKVRRITVKGEAKRVYFSTSYVITSSAPLDLSNLICSFNSLIVRVSNNLQSFSKSLGVMFRTVSRNFPLEYSLLKCALFPQ